jgi:phospholipase C
VPNNWSVVDYPAAPYVAKTIADQLVERGHTWKTYQESLPGTGPRVDGVNYADGTYSNLSPAAAFQVGGATKAVAKLYAVKHNPFVYFRNIQQGSTPELSFARVVDFDGPHGLFADLARGTLPTFSFVAPNQCHDMHGAGGDSAQCGDDTHAIQMGDADVKKLVGAIKASPAWHDGRNAIVVLWDENDYDNAANKVAFLVETNYGKHRVVSPRQYNHYSLTRTLEAAFGLPCLNHACDRSTEVMADLFGDD